MGKAFKSYRNFVQTLFCIFFMLLEKKIILKWDNLGKKTFLNSLLRHFCKGRLRERIKIHFLTEQNCRIDRA